MADVQSEGDALAISVTEAARLIGISRNAYYAGIRGGTLPGIRVASRRYIVPKARLQEWLNNGSQS